MIQKKTTYALRNRTTGTWISTSDSYFSYYDTALERIRKNSKTIPKGFANLKTAKRHRRLQILKTGRDDIEIVQLNQTIECIALNDDYDSSHLMAMKNLIKKKRASLDKEKFCIDQLDEIFLKNPEDAKLMKYFVISKENLTKIPNIDDLVYMIPSEMKLPKWQEQVFCCLVKSDDDLVALKLAVDMSLMKFIIDIKTGNKIYG